MNFEILLDKLHIHRNRINDHLIDNAEQRDLGILIYNNGRVVGNVIWAETEACLLDMAYDTV